MELCIHAFSYVTFSCKTTNKLCWDSSQESKQTNKPAFIFCSDALWQSSLWDTNHCKPKISTNARDKQKKPKPNKNTRERPQLLQFQGKWFHLEHSKELEHAEGLLTSSSFTDRHTRFCIIHSKLTASTWCQHRKQSMLHNHALTPLTEKWKAKRLSLECRFLGEIIHIWVMLNNWRSPYFPSFFLICSFHYI